MKLFWRTLMIVLVAILVASNWLTLKSAIQRVEAYFDTSPQSALPERSRVNLAYPLSEEKWLDFSLLDYDQEIKIVSNAEVPVDVELNVDDRLIYTFEYQVVDGDGQVLKQGEISQKTRQLIFFDHETQQNYVSSSYYPAIANPLDSRLYMLNLRGYQGARLLRLRVKYKQQPITEVIARVYHHVPIASNKLDYQWQRMSIERKNSLARSSVYFSQQQLLTDEEKRLLINNLWTPMGPLGVNDKDYITKKLYVKREVEQDSIVNLSVVDPSGLMVYPDQYGVVKIPVFSGDVKLSWHTIDAANENDWVNVEWWGHPSTRYRQWRVKSQSELFVEPLDSGVIQLSVSTPTVFKVWINDESSPVEITPRNENLRLYQESDLPLSYQINHTNKKGTPFKIALRALLTSPAYSEVFSVDYTVFDKNNQLLASGTLAVDSTKSNYDKVSGDKTSVISNVQNYYFNFPENIDRIEFKSDKAVWVAAYSRPASLPLMAKYPFQQENATEQEQTIPAWFFVRPVNWKSYVTAGRTLLLALQPTPPEVDEMLMAGQYRWEQFLASGNWRGREILTAQYDEVATRDQTHARQYMQLEEGENYNLEFIGEIGESLALPRLLYLQPLESALIIRLWIDGKPYFNETVFSKTGELTLPAIEPGVHKVRLALSQSAELFLDRVKVVDKAFVKRLAIKLDSRPLEFTYTKTHDEELIAIRIYTPQESNLAQAIRLQISPVGNRKVGPFKNWSFVDRNYQLEANDGLPASMLGATIRKLAPPRLLFVKLGEDLPVGKNYQIKLSLTSGPEGYVMLSRTLPGIYDDRVIKYDKTSP